MKKNRQITSMIETEYKNKKRRNEIKKAQRTRQLYDKYPKLEQIDEQIGSQYLQIIKNSLNNESDHKSIYLNIDNLNKQRKQYVLDNKIDLYQMEIHYDCDICKDTGIIQQRENTQRCQCYINRYNALMYENSNMLQLTKKCNFDNFDISIFDDEKIGNKFSPREFMEKMKDKSLSFIERFDDVTDKSMIFYGDTGLGKSYLCLCICDELIKRKKNVVYETSIELFEKLADYVFSSEKKDGESSIFHSLVYNSDLLVIDDLGTEMTNNFVTTELFNIVNVRILKNKKTIISTNLSNSELQSRYDHRTFSRFASNYNFYKFVGKDLRLYSKKISN